MRYFGLLVDQQGSVVAAGPFEEVAYGPEPQDFFVVALSTGSDVQFLEGSACLQCIDLPVPSVN